VIISMQGSLLTRGWTMVTPLMMNVMRISSAFKRRRRWLVPATVAAMLVSIATTVAIGLHYAYSVGAANFLADGITSYPQNAFNWAQQAITSPSTLVRPRFGAMGFGAVVTALVMIMRAHFYWWPIHTVGLLTCYTWTGDWMWFQFFLGWLIKTSIVKIGGGRALRGARHFFIAFIFVEGFIDGVAALSFTLSGGAIPFF
jgi:hypothetical protein